MVKIEKIISTPRINNLRVINIYEADYNFLLKFSWSNKATKHAVLNKTLGKNQWGCISGCSVDIVAMIDELILETNHLTLNYLVMIQNDTKACFDRIINSYVMLNNRKFDIPDKICKLYSITLRNIKYWVQNTLGMSSYYYQHTSIDSTHDTRQV